jgi:hypothetical protein
MNLIAAGLGIAVIVWVGSTLVMGGDADATPPPMTEAATDPDPSSVPTQSPPPASPPAGYRAYALAFPDVRGLPSDLDAGARLELWVALEPPITKAPRIQKLIDGVLYDRTIPAVIEGQPPTAIVLVPEDKVGKLMYGDRYGALGAALVVD